MNDKIPFRTVGSKDRLVDRVVNEIERLIIAGQLEPGTKLPPERELGDEIGVSRTVVREAVRILVTKGLLETKPGVGTTVRQVTRDQLVEPLSLLLRTQGGGGISFEDLHQVRSILEVEIAGLAAAQATEADIANLKQIMIEMELTQNQPEVFAAKDASFHQALAQTTHNPILVILLDSLRDLLQEYLLLVVPRLDLSQSILPYHYQVLERVATKDEAGARQAMLEHLKRVRRNHEEAFGGERMRTIAQGATNE